MMSLKLMLFLQSTMTWKCDMMKYFWPIGNVQFNLCSHFYQAAGHIM